MSLSLPGGVILRACGVSSTPRLLGSIIGVSGILGRPVKPSDDTGCVFAFSRRIAPEVCTSTSLPRNRGRREDRVHAAPAVSCATRTEEHAHEHTGSAETLRPSLRNGFTVYFVLSPVNGFLATVIPEKLVSQEFDASTAASGPHDFAVRDRPHSSVAALASTASHRTFVTIANRPSSAVRRAY
jgi:hypothetical protein